MSPWQSLILGFGSLALVGLFAVVRIAQRQDVKTDDAAGPVHLR